MSRYQNNFKEYLLNKFEDKFYKVMNSWLYNNGEDFININTYKACYFEVTDIQNSSLYAGHKGNGVIDVDLNINPEIQYRNYYERGSYDVDMECHKWLTLSFEFDIKTNKVGYIDVDAYNPNKKKKPLDGNLTPIIKREQYEDYALEILKKYYPEALEGTPVNPYLLASRMNIDIEEVQCDDDNTFAKIYLGNKNRKDKIILNTSLCDEYSDAARNISIAHECVHKHLHRITYIFSRKRLSSSSEFTCTLDGTLYNGQIKMSEFIEPQANAIAPMILMPKNVILSDYYSVKNSYLSILNNETEAIKATLEELKDKFGVTMYAVKKRLFDLGIHEVKGISNFIDGKFIPDYYFKKGSLDYNEEYVISFKDLVKAYGNSNIWFKLTNYTYVDGFFVLNNDKYVEKNFFGNLELTNYALTHIDECCIKFKVDRKIAKSNHPFFQLGYFNRDKIQSYDYDYEIVAENKKLSDESTVEDFSTFCDDITETMKILLPLSWNECIKYLMESQGLTIASLAVNTGGDVHINKRTLERYIKGEVKNPSLEMITAICLALNVPMSITNHIFQRAGLQLNYIDPYHNAIFFTLNNLRGRSLEEINILFQKSFGKSLI